MLILRPQTRQVLRAEDYGKLVDEVNRNHLIAGDNVRLNRTPAGTVVSVSAPSARKEAATSLHPWKVRYHAPPPEDGEQTEPTPQWEVYLPAGTLTIGRSCYVMNNPASDEDGHDKEDENGHKEEYGWYKIPLLEVLTGTVTYHIVAHGKDNVQMKSGSNYAQAAPYVMVTAERWTAQPWYPQNDQTLAKQYAGDVWSAVIAEVTVKTETVDGETVVTRRVANSVRAAVNVPTAGWPARFRPRWMMTYDGDDAVEPLTTDELHIDSATLYVGTVATTAADADLAADGRNVVWLVVDTSKATPEAEFQVVPESGGQAPQESLTSQPVELFYMADNRVLLDLRDNLIGLYYYRGRL